MSADSQRGGEAGVGIGRRVDGSLTVARTGPSGAARKVKVSIGAGRNERARDRDPTKRDERQAVDDRRRSRLTSRAVGHDEWRRRR